jgi:hypothetical protein
MNRRTPRIMQKLKSSLTANGLIAMSSITIGSIILTLASGCTPTVRVEAPKEPIEINLNVKIEHHIRIQVDEELEDLFDDDSDVF